MDSASSLLAWQIVDSAFPTGAFAHSWGLEAAWHHGEIGDALALSRFVDSTVQQAAFGTVPLLNAAFAEPGRWDALDQLADAFLVNAVANRASRQQGRTLLTTAVQVWPRADIIAARQRASTLRVHLGPASGVVFRLVGLSLPIAQQIVLYGAARGVLSAAVRLGIVGSYEAQRMQLACMPSIERHARRCAGLDERDLAQVAPIPDLLQATHDRLYSRLFQS